MNAVVRKSRTYESWSAIAHVDFWTWVGMNAMSQAAITPAPFPKLSFAIAAIGNTISAPNTAGRASIAYQTDASDEIPRFVRSIATSAIDHENNGGRGLIPPTG